MILLGSDPEVILKNEDKYVSSHSAGIAGTKERPVNINGVLVHRDNVLVEFGITPTDDVEEWVSRHKKALEGIKSLLNSGIMISSEASAEFDFDELWHPESMSFGCAPERIAWDNGEERSASIYDAGNLRVAGGHVHIGYGECSPDFNIKLAKYLDLYLGLWSVLADEDTTRRKLYGLAGSYRDKPYGIEYRVLSNFWLFDEYYMEQVFVLAKKAFESALSGEFDELIETNGELIQEAINTYDRDLVEQFYMVTSLEEKVA